MAKREKKEITWDSDKSGSILINGAWYGFRVEEPGSAHALVTLQKFDSTGIKTYSVSIQRNGWEDCGCADFTYRRSREGGRCKHLKKLVEKGLIAEIQPYHIESVQEVAEAEAWASAVGV